MLALSVSEAFLKTRLDIISKGILQMIKMLCLYGIFFNSDSQELVSRFKHISNYFLTLQFSCSWVTSES